MSQNLLLTKVSGRYGTALFGVAKVITDRYGGIVSEVELPEYGLKTLKFGVVGASRKITRKQKYKITHGGVKYESIYCRRKRQF